MKAIPKYFYERNDTGECKEQCQWRNDGTMIGSVACKWCSQNAGSRTTAKIKWIKCKIIDQATNKTQQPHATNNH